MTPEAQRIAIAEACGWLLVVPYGSNERWWHFNGRGHFGDCSLPDYLNDLNAMHEAEMLCLRSISRMEEYRKLLKEILVRECAIELDFCACSVHRLEALIRTLNLWDETK